MPVDFRIDAVPAATPELSDLDRLQVATFDFARELNHSLSIAPPSPLARLALFVAELTKIVAASSSRIDVVATQVATFDHTPTDRDVDPCDECLRVMSREQLVAAIQHRQLSRTAMVKTLRHNLVNSIREYANAFRELRPDPAERRRGMYDVADEIEKGRWLR